MLKWSFIFFLNLLWCFSADAVENLALNKSYSYSPKPNYPLCTDELDAAQLTDGKNSGSKWTEKSTVGWRKPEPVVEVVIDLGRSCVVDRVDVHTIGGGFATVNFPDFLAVLLSDTNRQFKFAGLVSGRELTKIHSNANQGVPRIMSIENINASGRFVKLIARPKGPAFFMDEIEVFGEKLSALNNVTLRENLEIFETDEELLGRIDDILIRKEQTLSGKNRVEKYKQAYQKPFVCLPVNPMEIVFEKEMQLREKAKEINIKMWQNEYESAAFDIINCSQDAMNFTVSVSPLLGPDGRIIDRGRTFTIKRAQYIIASEIGSIADALILQDERPFEIMPGQLVQIWLTIHNPQLTAGTYEAKIAVSATQENGEKLPLETIPVVLKIHENRIPDKTALNTCVWDYYYAGPMEEMAEDLRNHYTNVCVVPAQDLPFLRFSSDPPGVTRKPDYSKLDKIIELHQYAETFLLGLNFSTSQKDFGRFGDVKWMSDDWKRVFSSWLKELVTHLKALGISYEKFALYPFDESIADEYYELARLIKSIDPEIRLYANSFGKGPEDFIRFRELIDIWCLQDSHIIKHPEWFEMVKSFGGQMWIYECLEPMKAQKPYSYYRLLSWRAFQRGQNGAGFWIYYYGQNFKQGAVPWNDTLRPLGFSGVVYGASGSPVPRLTENIIPSRRWEAWREGVEDYQYLYELQQVIKKIRITDTGAAKAAQQILDNQVNRVLDSPDDCNIVYEAREILTETLQKLSNKTNLDNPRN